MLECSEQGVESGDISGAYLMSSIPSYAASPLGSQKDCPGVFDFVSSVEGSFAQVSKAKLCQESRHCDTVDTRTREP